MKPSSWLQTVGLPLIALLLAVVVWFLLDAKHEVTRELDLRFELELPETLRSSYLIVSQTPRTVRLRCTGSRADVDWAEKVLHEYEARHALDSVLQVDARDFAAIPESMSLSIDLPERKLDFPGSVNLYVSQPRAIVLALDRIATVELKIQNAGEFIGELPQGCQRVEVASVKPDRLRVTGPANQFRNGDTLAMEGLPLGPGGFTPETPSRYVKVTGLSRGLPLTIAERVLVEVVFVPHDVEWTAPDIDASNIVIQTSPNSPYTIKVDLPVWESQPRKGLQLAGPSDVIQRLKNGDSLRYFIDCTSLTDADLGQQYPRIQFAHPDADRVRVVGEPPALPIIVSRRKDDGSQ